MTLSHHRGMGSSFHRLYPRSRPLTAATYTSTSRWTAFATRRPDNRRRHTQSRSSRSSAWSPFAAPPISINPDPADDDLLFTQSVSSQMEG